MYKIRFETHYNGFGWVSFGTLREAVTHLRRYRYGKWILWDGETLLAQSGQPEPRHWSLFD